ncbi:MAG TPA: NADP-dependent oxidoreductase [Acidimicrobiales bacterium]|jgi:NADPH:quinone reductase-like Zn-dependent oxidoreductase
MRAIGVTRFGGPEVLQVVDLPDPVAGPGELALRVHAATVNPTDTVLRSGGRAQQLKDVPPPYIPGMDVAGTLEQIGTGTNTDLRIGERVMGIVVPLGAHGAYAELIVLPVESVVRSPAGTTDAQAATLPMNGLTARMALDELALEPGQTLAVTGAAGAVGGYAVQLGRAAGLWVVADAAPADEALVRALGADVIVPRGDDFAVEVRHVVASGTDGLVDGALLEGRAIGAVRDGGAMATLRGYEGADLDAPARRGVTVVPVFVRNYARQRAKLDELRAQAEAGVLTLRVARTFPAKQALEAHRLLEAGGIRGRLVLEF